MNNATRIFETERDLMYTIAYRLLGSFSDAEDVVQDAWFRWRGIDTRKIESPRAWLTTIVSRICIDRLRRRKIEKLNYVGPWLPEPVIEPVPERRVEEGAPAVALERAESISIAFMHLLESLNPVERAVFVLKDAFELAHDEVADVLGITPAHSRQLLKRAKSKLGDYTEVVRPVPEEDARQLFTAFMRAAEGGDLEALKTLLAEDVVAISDGGGRVSAALIPLYGFEKVTTVLLHLLRNQKPPLRFEWANINDCPGLVAYQDGVIHSVTTAEIRHGKISRIFTVRNPGKLRRIVEAG